MRRAQGYVLYQGPSRLNGEPIVAIATMRTANVKTGNMVQTWILTAEVSPEQAVKTGADEAVCGSCPHRHFLNGGCYVVPFQAPRAVWESWRRGLYREAWEPEAFKDMRVRLGSYGDPAAVPAEVWQEMLKYADASTGYTHQAHRREFQQELLTHLMVSADTPAAALKAHAEGLRTFRVKAQGDPLLPGEILCATETDPYADCSRCLLCSGARQGGPSVAINAHGQRARRVPAEQRAAGQMGLSLIPTRELQPA